MKGAIGIAGRQVMDMTQQQHDVAGRLYAQLYPGKDVEQGVAELCALHLDGGRVTFRTGRAVIGRLLAVRRQRAGEEHPCD